ncbi:MAG: translocation/assembly module TamB domain-containing protein, partial [Actinomycetota bacterium]
DSLPGAIKAAVVLDRWPAVWTKEYQARLSGEVRAAGTLAAPKIKGQLEVLEAVLKPNLAFLDDTPVRRDETIVLVPAPEAAKPQADRSGDGKAGLEGGAFENLALDVGVRLHRATRIEHPNAEVELEGDLRARQPRGGTLTLVGALEAVRGWAGFKGRRFTLREGRAAFTGGETINPLLTIVASHRLPGYTVDLIVGGSLNEPSLGLQSEPHLEPSDILALLLFGKPVRALSRSEQRGLQHQTLDVVSGYAASMLAESVSEALGLADLGIDVREVDFSGGRIGFARHLTPDTRIGVSQELAGEQGQEISIEHQLAPRWNIEASTRTKGSSAIDLFWRWPD